MNVRRFRPIIVIMTVTALVAISGGTTHAAWPHPFKKKPVLQVSATMAWYFEENVTISEILILGRNQDGKMVGNIWRQEPWTSQDIEVPGWWWDFSDPEGVLVELYLDGFGWRSCGDIKLQKVSRMVDKVHLIYRGQNETPRCTVLPL